MKTKIGQAGMFVLVFLVVMFITVIGLSLGFDVVKAGHAGVTDRFGDVGEKSLEPGIHWTGFTVSTKEMSIRIQRQDYSASAASKDLQTVSTQVTVNYKLLPTSAPEIYKTIGTNYEEVILFPVVQEAVKSATAKYTAEQLITLRSEVKKLITDTIIEKVQEKGLVVTEVAITNFDFSPEFNRAIELKQTAEQDALKALNEKKKTITQAEAQADKLRLDADAAAYSIKARADAEAYSLRVVREELSKSKDLVQYKAVEKWSGTLPTFYTDSGAGMLFNLPVMGE